jgi:hypothetical protein
MNMRRYIFLACVAAVAISSCGLLGTGGVSLEFQSSGSSPAASVASRSTIATGVVVTEFLVSIREVEFKQDESDPDNPADVFFEGPYTLDLLDAGNPVSQTIGEADVPPGEYQAIRFKLHKTESVDATGIVVGDAPLTVTIDFNLPSFLDQSAGEGVLIDLSTATDGDGDGTIEINPNSDDGSVNRDLADDLKDNIKLVADIVDS